MMRSGKPVDVLFYSFASYEILGLTARMIKDSGNASLSRLRFLAFSSSLRGQCGGTGTQPPIYGLRIAD